MLQIVFQAWIKYLASVVKLQRFASNGKSMWSQIEAGVLSFPTGEESGDRMWHQADNKVWMHQLDWIDH